MNEEHELSNDQGMGRESDSRCCGVQMLRGPARSRPMRADQSRGCFACQALVSVTLPLWLQRMNSPLRQLQRADMHAQNLSCDSGTQVTILGISAPFYPISGQQAGRRLRMQKALAPERPLSMHISPRWVFPRSRRAPKLLCTAHDCCGKSLRDQTAVPHVRSACCSYSYVITLVLTNVSTWEAAAAEHRVICST